MADIHLNVSGMSCGHCVARVEKALAGVSGVERVQVSLDAGAAFVTAGDADRAALVKAVEEAGYRAAVVD